MAVIDVPPELLGAGHPVWHSASRYRRWMGGPGWTIPARDRLRGTDGARPATRRRATAAE